MSTCDPRSGAPLFLKESSLRCVSLSESQSLSAGCDLNFWLIRARASEWCVSACQRDHLSGAFLFLSLHVREQVAISTSGSCLLALLEDGTVFAWGDNSRGQCGAGENRQSKEFSTPIRWWKSRRKFALFISDFSARI